MRHPAEHFIKYLIIRNPTWNDAAVLKRIDDFGILPPNDKYLPFLRQEIPAPPPGFNWADWNHRPSMRYLREQGVYELFHPDEGVEAAWTILTTPELRLVVEQVLLSKMRDGASLKQGLQRLNKKNGWHLTEEAVLLYGKFFWNSKLLTFDEWGRFLYGRTAMYERHMAYLQGAGLDLVYFHLRLDQNIESKNMITRAQQIAYFTLEEVNQKPGTSADKVKAIAVLSKTINECHESLSTSDMALKDVLKQFERFRMQHQEQTPADIRELAPKGNYSGSGAYDKLPN